MPQDAPEVRERLHDIPLLHTLLARRGLSTRVDAQAFLDHAELPLPDPGLLVDIALAVSRIEQAVTERERIAIFGDYDVDGITASAILFLALQPVVSYPDQVIIRLPTREEGYGMSPGAIRELAAAGVTLLVAVDCGSSDEEGVALARSLGMDVVIVDHHHMTTTGPAGAVTISPARPDCGIYREMSAAGLALLLAAALESSPAFDAFRRAGGAAQLADLAALGLVADVSAMTGPNRQIVRDGLRLMRREPRLGIRTLCDIASIDVRTLNTMNIGYGIAPRLNAAGRMANPRVALDLLLTRDPLEAQRLATELEHLNRLRQKETDQVIEEVCGRLASSVDLASSPLLMESSPEWRTGILGLAAGKLVERLGRPVILVREDGELASGSCRSVPGLHIVDLLRRHSHLLDRFGGHSQAAGLTLPIVNLPELRQQLLEDPAIQNMELPFEPELQIDAEIRAEHLTLDIARQIMRLSPFGAGNPEPVFLLPSVSIVRMETMGRDGSHLRMVWRGLQGEIRAPFFSAASRARELSPGQRADVACTLSISHWNGPRLDVKVLDFRPAIS